MSALAAAVSAASGVGATLHTGTVVAILGGTVAVSIDHGDPITMPRLNAYQPILGDQVQVLQQSGLNLALDRTSNISGANALTNPSFELDLAGTVGAPAAWTLVPDPAHTTPITATVQTATPWGGVDGTQWLQLASSTTGGDAGTRLVSEAVPCTPGQSWTAAAHVTAAGTASNSAALSIGWWADGSSADPATAVAVVGIAAAQFPLGSWPAWLVLRHLTGTGAVCPAGATAVRLILGVDVLGVGSVIADGLILRQIS